VWRSARGEHEIRRRADVDRGHRRLDDSIVGKFAVGPLSRTLFDADHDGSWMAHRGAPLPRWTQAEAIGWGVGGAVGLARGGSGHRSDARRHRITACGPSVNDS